MKSFIIVFLVFIVSIFFIQDKYKTEAVPLVIQKYYKANLNKYSIPQQKIQDAYDLGKIISERDTSDLTNIIQESIDKYPIIIFPDFGIRINKSGLRLRSNSLLIFREKSQLTIEPNDLKRYAILHIERVENVTVYHPKLIGDKFLHTGTKGEWGMGIFVSGSKNISIYKPHIRNTWGDGIYIGRTKNISCENVQIYDADIDNGRRNGISIISGNNILIDNAIVSNTYGTNPMAGIDVEPNNNNDFLKNITLKNIYTFNNKNSGIILSLKGLVGKEKRSVDISIKNHTDIKSKYALNISSGNNKTTLDGYPVSGVISVEDVKYYDNSLGIQIFNAKYNDLYINISKSILLKDGKSDNEGKAKYKLQIDKYYKTIK